MSETMWQEIDHKLCGGEMFADEDEFYGVFRKMRQEDPVHWTVGPDGTAFWSLFKHADIKRVVNDPDLFSSQANGQMPFFNKDFEIVAQEAFGIGENLLVTDPPRHTELRNVIEPPLRPQALHAYSERCHSLIKEIFDAIPENGEVDLVADVAAKIPMAVICDLLDVPEEDRAQLHIWGKMTLAATDPDYTTEGTPLETMLAGFRGMREYFGTLGEARRGCPHQDLISRMANTDIKGQPMTPSELAYNSLQLAIAGFETTRNAFSGGVLALLQHPKEMAKLRENPKRIRLAVDEVLRWANALLCSMRTATADTEIGGKRIKAGDRIVFWLASANRDEDVFDNPEEFNVSRQPNMHISLGGGPHFCLGGPLGKMELGFALEELLERYDGIEIIGTYERLQTNFVGGLKRLPVRLIARSTES